MRRSSLKQVFMSQFLSPNNVFQPYFSTIRFKCMHSRYLRTRHNFVKHVCFDDIHTVMTDDESSNINR